MNKKILKLNSVKNETNKIVSFKITDLNSDKILLCSNKNTCIFGLAINS